MVAATTARNSIKTRILKKRAGTTLGSLRGSIAFGVASPLVPRERASLSPPQKVMFILGGGGGSVWARHQQEHRPQRPTESSDPTQHAKGRTGDRPGPRKGATTRRNVTQGVCVGTSISFRWVGTNDRTTSYERRLSGTIGSHISIVGPSVVVIVARRCSALEDSGARVFQYMWATNHRPAAQLLLICPASPEARWLEMLVRAIGGPILLAWTKVHRISCGPAAYGIARRHVRTGPGLQITC